MSTSKQTIRDNHAHALLDYVIYGDDTLTKLDNPNIGMLDITIDIKRCEDAAGSIGAALRFASASNVCDECEEEHGNFIDTVEGSHSDIDCHLDTIVNAYQALQERNAHLENIIQDLIGLAVNAVDDDDLEQFEEKLILEKLKGEK